MLVSLVLDNSQGWDWVLVREWWVLTHNERSRSRSYDVCVLVFVEAALTLSQRTGYLCERPLKYPIIQHHSCTRGIHPFTAAENRD